MDDIALDGVSQHSPTYGSSNKTQELDVEQKPLADAYLMNHVVKTFAWKDIAVTVKDRHTKQSKTLLQHVDGTVAAGSCSPWLNWH